MYPNDPIVDWFECYGSNKDGFKVRNGDYVYYFRTIDDFKNSLEKLEIYTMSRMPLLHNAWFVIKNDNTIIKSRLLIEDLVDMAFPILIGKDD